MVTLISHLTEGVVAICGAVPGSVSPFGLLNDAEGQVTFFLDENSTGSKYDYLVSFSGSLT